MSVTNRSKEWEITNSLYLIFFFICCLNWVPFFWMGIFAKQKKWIWFGFMYIVLCFVPYFLIGVSDNESILFGIMTFLLLFAWLASIIHAFLSHKEFLIRLDMVEKDRAAEKEAYRQKVQNQYKYQYQYTQQQAPPPMHPVLAAKKAVNDYLLTNVSTPFFRQKLTAVSGRLDTFFGCCRNIQNVISARFGSAGLSYEKFASPVIEIQEHSVSMVNQLVSRLLMFNEEEYSRRIYEFTQAGRQNEAQAYMEHEQDYKDYAVKTLLTNSKAG